MARRTKVTKGEMVRQAIEAGAAMPGDGTAWIKEHFGVTMKPNNFSNFKTMLNKGSGSSVARQAGAAGSVARKPRGRPAGAGNGMTGGASAGIRLEEMRTLKELVDRIGATGVAEAAEMLGKGGRG